MLHLLQLEWLKLKNLKIFRVLAILYIALMPLLILVGKAIPAVPNPIFDPASIYKFPKIFEWMAYEGNWLAFFFLGFMSLIMVTNEYQNKTLRQNIITGVSRQDYFLSKLFFVLVTCLGATLVYFIFAFIFGVVHTSDLAFGEILGDGLVAMGKYFLMCLGYMSFGLFLGLLIKRTGIAVFLYLAWVMFLELIMRWLIHFKAVENLDFIPNKTMHFYPMNAVEDLTPNPFMKIGESMASNFAEQEGFSFFLSAPEAVITSIVYICIFLFFSYRILMKSDL